MFNLKNLFQLFDKDQKIKINFLFFFDDNKFIIRNAYYWIDNSFDKFIFKQFWPCRKQYNSKKNHRIYKLRLRFYTKLFFILIDSFGNSIRKQVVSPFSSSILKSIFSSSDLII